MSPPGDRKLTKVEAEQIAEADVRRHFADIDQFEVPAAILTENAWMVVTKFHSRGSGPRLWVHMISAADGEIQGHIDGTP